MLRTLPLAACVVALAACASSPFAGRPAFRPLPPTSDTEAVIAAAFRHVLADPAPDLESLLAEQLIPVGSVYYVREGDGWAPVPLPASALPVGTGRQFALVSEEEARRLTDDRRTISVLSVSIGRMAQDTASVHVGRRDVYRATGSPYGGGSSRIGRFVRSNDGWAFDAWTGWIGS